MLTLNGFAEEIAKNAIRSPTESQDVHTDELEARKSL